MRLALLAVTALGCSAATPENVGEPRLLFTRQVEPPQSMARVVATQGAAIFVGGFGQSGDAGQDAFLERLGRDGARDWSVSWGSDASDFVTGIVAREADVRVAGYTPGKLATGAPLGGHDAFVTSCDPAGDCTVSTTLGTDQDDYVYAAVGTEQGVVLAGYTRGAFPGFDNAGASDVFVASVDDAPERRWVLQLGSSGTDYAQAIARDGDDNLLVAGYTAGELGDTDAAAEDAFVVKMTPKGDVAWVAQWGSETADYALGIACDAAGNSYVVGYTYGSLGAELSQGGEDAYLTKLDRAGNLLWTRQWGSPARDSARSVALAANGDVYVTGDTEGALGAASAGSRDAFLMRFSSDGERSFTAQWGTAAREFSLASAVDGQTLYVAGYVESSSSRQAQLSAWLLP